MKIFKKKLETFSRLPKEKAYLVLALFFGTISVFLLPPFQTPDEPNHFQKAWAVGSGFLVCSGHDTISKDAFDLSKKLKLEKIEGSSEKKASLAKIKALLFQKDSGQKKDIGGVVCPALPIGYIPQAIGVDIGRLFGFSPLAGFYLARLLNLLAGVIITYFAIRILPFGKIIFVLIGLLPMTIHQFASLNYDALHISLIFLFIAYVLKLSSEKEKPFRKKEGVLLFLLSLFSLSVKFGYFPLSLLVFILPKEKFRTKKHYWLFSLGIVLANAAAFLAGSLLLANSANVEYSKGINPTEQLGYIFNQPWSFLYTVFENFYKRFFFYFESLIFKPGWLEKSLPFFFYISAIFGITALIRSEDEKVNFDKKQRFVILGAFLANFIFIFLSLYMIWTKVGSNRIEGVQGRYFLSFFPLFLLFFYKSNFNFRFESVKKNKNLFLAGFLLLMFFYAFFFVFRLYYL